MYGGRRPDAVCWAYSDDTLTREGRQPARCSYSRHPLVANAFFRAPQPQPQPEPAKSDLSLGNHHPIVVTALGVRLDEYVGRVSESATHLTESRMGLSGYIPSKVWGDARSLLAPTVGGASVCSFPPWWVPTASVAHDEVSVMDSLFVPAVPGIYFSSPVFPPPGSCASLTGTCATHTCGDGNVADPTLSEALCALTDCVDDDCCIMEGDEKSTHMHICRACARSSEITGRFPRVLSSCTEYLCAQGLAPASYKYSPPPVIRAEFSVLWAQTFHQAPPKSATSLAPRRTRREDAPVTRE